ncbi:MAG: ABC transporter ATP-binding protein [Gammaproteobacteria bacterium]
MNKAVSGQKVLEAHRLSRVFIEAGTELTILAEINLSVEKSNSIAIVGPSGSGKTALLNLLAGLDEPGSGWVAIESRRLDRLKDGQLAQLRRRRLGFVYQFSHLLPQFTVLDNVAMPLYLDGVAKNKAAQRARQLLQAVGLEHRQQALASNLSGGERQRVAIARAVVAEPACVLMDEPTGSLDSDNTARVQEMIWSLAERVGCALVMATHDDSLADRADLKFKLDKGILQPV